MLERERVLEGGDVLGSVEQEQVAVLAQLDPVHPLELVERAERDPDVELIGELRADPAGRAARRAGGERVALEQNDVGNPELA